MNPVDRCVERFIQLLCLYNVLHFTISIAILYIGRYLFYASFIVGFLSNHVELNQLFCMIWLGCKLTRLISANLYWFYEYKSNGGISTRERTDAWPLIFIRIFKIYQVGVNLDSEATYRHCLGNECLYVLLIVEVSSVSIT